jgi:hypothetical protein
MHAVLQHMLAEGHSSSSSSWRKKKEKIALLAKKGEKIKDPFR